ncbi:MAG: response regulator [Bacteroidia bacterium]
MKKKLNLIMLIDDDEDDNYFHQLIINEADVTHHLRIAVSGFEALEILANETPSPDLIFLDINMPKMNGWEFLGEYEKLSFDLKAKNVIIMLTTSLNPDDEEKAKKFNRINGFENKPLSQEMIKRIVKKHFSDYAAID